MKARLPTADSILKDYADEMAGRMLKMACMVLVSEHHFGHDRLADFCSKMSELGEELVENPYKWVRIDEELIDKRKLGDVFKREDLDEREYSAERIKKI